MPWISMSFRAGKASENGIHSANIMNHHKSKETLVGNVVWIWWGSKEESWGEFSQNLL